MTRSRRLFGRGSRPLVVAAFGFALLLGSTSQAKALGDYVNIEAYYWDQSLEGEAAIDDGIAGTSVDFHDGLGITDSVGVGAARLRLRAGRNFFLFDYFDSSHEGDSAGQTFTFGGISYGPGETIHTKSDLTHYAFQYRFDVLNLKVFSLGIGAGAAKSAIRMDVKGSVSGAAKLDETVPYPTLNLAVAFKPFPGFAIRAEGSGLGANYSGTSVHALDARFQVEWYFAHVFGVFAGYRSYRFDADDKDFGRYDTTYKGPYAGLGLKF